MFRKIFPLLSANRKIPTDSRSHHPLASNLPDLPARQKAEKGKELGMYAGVCQEAAYSREAGFFFPGFVV